MEIIHTGLYTMSLSSQVILNRCSFPAQHKVPRRHRIEEGENLRLEMRKGARYGEKSSAVEIPGYDIYLHQVVTKVNNFWLIVTLRD